MNLDSSFSLDDFIKFGLGVGAMFQFVCLIAAFYCKSEEFDEQFDLNRSTSDNECSPTTSPTRLYLNKKNRFDKKKKR